MIHTVSYMLVVFFVLIQDLVSSLVTVDHPFKNVCARLELESEDMVSFSFLLSEISIKITASTEAVWRIEVHFDLRRSGKRR